MIFPPRKVEDWLNVHICVYGDLPSGRPLPIHDYHFSKMTQTWRDIPWKTEYMYIPSEGIYIALCWK